MHTQSLETPGLEEVINYSPWFSLHDQEHICMRRKRGLHKSTVSSVGGGSCVLKREMFD